MSARYLLIGPSGRTHRRARELGLPPRAVTHASRPHDLRGRDLDDYAQVEVVIAPGDRWPESTETLALLRRLRFKQAAAHPNPTSQEG